MRKSEVEKFFDENLKHVLFTSSLVRRLKNFRLEWVIKNEDHIEFLGSNLLGVHKIIFSSQDDDKLLEDIYGITDPDKLQKELYTLKGMSKKYKVGSNLIYQLLVYTMYRFLNNDTLNSNQKEEGITTCGLIMQYRMITSIYFRYFKYPVSKAVAIETYERYSYKFGIKQKKNWQNVFIDRCKSITDKHGINRKKLERYTEEDALRIVTDIQTKLRRSIVTMYKVMLEVLEEENTLKQLSDVIIDATGEKSIADNDNVIINIKHNINNIIYRENDFINNEIVNIVLAINKNVDYDNFIKYLRYVSNKDNHKDINKKILKKLDYNLKEVKDPFIAIINDIININTSYLQRTGININDRSKIPNAIISIKNYWSSGIINDNRVNIIKQYLIDIGLIATGKKTKWLLSSISISFIIYLHLRSLKD